MAATWGDITNILGLRQARRQGVADKFYDAAKGFQQQAFTTREAEKAREFEAGEGELDRALQLEQIGAQGEQNRLLQELVGAQAAEQIGLRGAEERESIAASSDERIRQIQEEARLQGLQIDDNQAHEIDLIQEQLRAEQDLIDFERAKFANGFYQSATKRYEWNTPEQYKAAMAELQADEQLQNLLESQTARESSPEKVWQVYEGMKEAAHEMMWRYDPNAIDPMTGQAGVYVRREEVPVEQIREYFKNLTAMSGFDAQSQASMLEAYETWLQWASENPPEIDPAEGGAAAAAEFGTGGSVWQRMFTDPDSPLGKHLSSDQLRTLAASGAGGMLATLPLETGKRLFSWIPNIDEAIDWAAGRITGQPIETPIPTPGEILPTFTPPAGTETEVGATTDTYIPRVTPTPTGTPMRSPIRREGTPEGVESVEYDVWRKLTNLINSADASPEDKQKAQEYLADIEASGESDLITFYTMFLRRAGF